ncbi:MAG TPA: outer membrane beta-barrel protein [Steroidobacteraceae bacterium]|nr:outer membrane beta-barrel protein [Steroidobacteraceae bacterium]
MFRTTGIRRALAAAVAVLLGLGISHSAAADEPDTSGFYIGAGLGQFDVKIDSLEGVGDVLEDLDADDSAWKLMLGWRFNPYIALEADYIDLGAPNGNFDATGSSGKYKVEFAGVATYVIGSIPIGIFELSGKLGYYWHDADLRVNFDNAGPNNGNVFNGSSSAEAVTYGVGAGVTFFEHLNTKIEYEFFDIDDVDDAYALWLTAAWRF